MSEMNVPKTKPRASVQAGKKDTNHEALINYFNFSNS